MKRLLCIISSLDAGGAETFLMKISRALPAEKYQLDFVVSAEGGCYTEEVLSRGGKIYFVPLRTKHPIKSFNILRHVVKENQYKNVLKLGDTAIGVIDLLASKCGGAKVLAMRSCNALADLSMAKKLIHSALKPLLNIVANVKIAPSMLAAEFTFGKKQAHKNVHILHNAVDLQVFRYEPQGRNAIREEFSLEQRLVVGHIGRFSAQKNHKYLLEIFKQIKQLREDACLMLVGTGELEQQIRQQADELGIADSVIYTGVRFDIPQLLSAMDVFVFPSLYEGMPNTVIEAQATGLPCVIADTITKEADITGLVQYLPLDNAQHWAKIAVATIRERKNTYEDLAEHEYDIESVVRAFLRICLRDE